MKISGFNGIKSNFYSTADWVSLSIYFSLNILSRIGNVYMNNIMVINMGLKSIRGIIFYLKRLKLGDAALAINTVTCNI